MTTSREELLGVNIRRARKARGLRQEDIAAHLDVNVKQVQRWERGENVPGGMNLARLVNYFRRLADRPDLSILDSIVAQEVGAALAEEQNYAPDARARGLTLMDQLIRYPQRYERWLVYGAGLLDAGDDIV